MSPDVFLHWFKNVAFASVVTIIISYSAIFVADCYSANDQAEFCTIHERTENRVNEPDQQYYTLTQVVPFGNDRRVSSTFKSYDEAIDLANKINCPIK